MLVRSFFSDNRLVKNNALTKGRKYERSELKFGRISESIENSAFETFVACKDKTCDDRIARTCQPGSVCIKQCEPNWIILQLRIPMKFAIIVSRSARFSYRLNN